MGQRIVIVLAIAGAALTLVFWLARPELKGLSSPERSTQIRPDVQRAESLESQQVGAPRSQGQQVLGPELAGSLSIRTHLEAPGEKPSEILARIRFRALWDQSFSQECSVRINAEETLDLPNLGARTPDARHGPIELLAKIEALGYHPISRVVELLADEHGGFRGELLASLATAGRTVTGVVVFHDGKPVPDCDIGAFEFSAGEPNAMPIATCRSQSEGEFTIELPEDGDIALAAVCSGMRPSIAQLDGDRPLRIVLDAGQAISGLVATSSATGSTTVVSARLANASPSSPGWHSLAWIDGRFEYGNLLSESNSNGEFVLGGLMAATYEVMPGLVNPSITFIEAGEKIEAPRAGVVLGSDVVYVRVITETSGSALPRCTVEVEELRAVPDTNITVKRTKSLSTNIDGIVDVYLQRHASLKLLVLKSGFTSVEQDLDTDKLEARSERRIELVPKLALARMRVTVVTADGSTIASLHARSLADGWEARAERREGVYTFNDIPLDAHEFRFSVGPGDRGTVSGSYLLDRDVRIDPLGGAEIPVVVDMALGGRLRVLRGDRNASSPADLEIKGPGGAPISSLMARNEEDIEHGLPARAMLSSILQRSDWELLEVFPNLPPGAYSLKCTRADRTEVELPFTIRAGRGVDLDLAPKAR